MFRKFFKNVARHFASGPAGKSHTPERPKQPKSKNMKLGPKMIFVTFQKEGIHAYPDAPDQVEFLKHPHRHIFHFKVWIEVFHNDREMEFIIFKRWCEQQYREKTLTLDHKSCEMMADDLYLKIKTVYPNREVWIEVSEDGENGVIAQYSLEKK